MSTTKSELEARLDRLAERVATLEQEVTDLREDKQELREENHALRARLDDHDERLDDVEAAVVNLDSEVLVPDGGDRDLTWMERYHHHGTDGVDDEPRVRDLHGYILMQSIPDWAVRVPAGIVLKTDRNVRSKLKRRLDSDSFDHKQLYRACEALEERTDGLVEYHADHAKRGKHLFIPEAAAKGLTFDLSAVSTLHGKEDRRVLSAML